MGTQIAYPNIAEKYSEEIARSRAFYRGTVLPLLKEEGNAVDGHIVAVAFENDDYEVHKNEVEAMTKLRDRHPDAFVWVERIGFKTVYAIGGGSIRDD